MAGRWMSTKQAAEYMGASITTVKRHIEKGYLNWHVTPGGFKRLDREQIDALFMVPAPSRADRNRGIVTPEEERRYVRL